MKITDDIYQIVVDIPNNPIANANCYLIKGKAGWTMIDTGFFTEPSFDSLKQGLDKLGVAFAAIETIIITHAHSDHIGNAGRIKQLSPQTKIIMHGWEGALIETRFVNFFEFFKKTGEMLERHGVPPFDVSIFTAASMPTLDLLPVVSPDRVLYGGEIIATGIYDLEIIWTPGHSPGHICIYEPQNRILFSGDHVLPVITPNVGCHLETSDDPLGDYLKALQKIRNLSVALVLPGHEYVFKNLKSRIDAICAHHKIRKREILEILKNGSLNAYRISEQLTWNMNKSDWEKLPDLQKRIAVSETIAHLERLRWECRIKRINEGNSTVYTVV